MAVRDRRTELVPRRTEVFFARPSYDSPTGHFHVRYGHMGEHVADNVNAVGLIVDDDRREIDSAASKTVWVGSGAFEQIRYNSNYNIYWGQTGVLRSWKVDESLNVEFRNRLSTSVSWAEEYKLFEKDFRNRQAGVDVGYNTREYESLRMGLEFTSTYGSRWKQRRLRSRFSPPPGPASESPYTVLK